MKRHMPPVGGDASVKAVSCPNHAGDGHSDMRRDRQPSRRCSTRASNGSRYVRALTAPSSCGGNCLR